eukprot:g4107.t1
MTTLRRFRCDDLFRFDNVNLDRLTETYNLHFYLLYLATWPEMCIAAETPSGQLSSYVIGKVEGEGTHWHGHVTAISVAPEYRRLKLAKKLMDLTENITEQEHDGYFVDLFVRASNETAIAMYKRLGYIVYRVVEAYYSGEEDAFDMRKAMKRDKEKKSMIAFGRRVQPSELEFD